MNALIRAVKKVLQNPLRLFQWRNWLRFAFVLRLLYVLKVIEWKHKDCWIFLLPSSLGDIMQICGRVEQFKKKKGGKVVVIVKNKERANLVALFPGIDEVIDFNRFGLNSFSAMDKVRHKNLKIGRIFAFIPTPDCFFLNVPQWRRKDIVLKKYLDLPDVYCDYLEMRQCQTQIVIPKIDWKKWPMSHSLQDNDFQKTILIFPDATTMVFENAKSFWLTLACFLKKQGYEVLFNANDGEYDGFTCKFLPLYDVLLLAHKCAGVIGIRSGILEVMALAKPSRLIGLYPLRIVASAWGVEFSERAIDCQRKGYLGGWNPDVSIQDNFKKIYALERNLGPLPFAREISLSDNVETDIQAIWSVFCSIAPSMCTME